MFHSTALGRRSTLSYDDGKFLGMSRGGDGRRRPECPVKPYGYRICLIPHVRVAGLICSASENTMHPGEARSAPSRNILLVLPGLSSNRLRPTEVRSARNSRTPSRSQGSGIRVQPRNVSLLTADPRLPTPGAW